jgi:hypothetical protein
VTVALGAANSNQRGALSVRELYKIRCFVQFVQMAMFCTMRQKEPGWPDCTRNKILYSWAIGGVSGFLQPCSAFLRVNSVGFFIREFHGTKCGGTTLRLFNVEQYGSTLSPL